MPRNEIFLDTSYAIALASPKEVVQSKRGLG